MLPMFKRRGGENGGNQNSSQEAAPAAPPQNNAQQGGLPVANFVQQPTYAYTGHASPGQAVMVVQQPNLYGNQQVMYGQPMQPVQVIATQQELITPQDAKLYMVYRQGRIISVFGIIDVLGVLINAAFYSWLFLLVLPLPVCGIIAGQNYKIPLARFYAFFLILEIAGRIALMFYSTTGSFFFTLLFILVVAWILNYVVRFIKAVQTCSESEIQELIRDKERIRRLGGRDSCFW
ncbi:unnamed protein product [Heterosigma akashiwo]